ncbi:MAG: cytochrome ubiquinol oxidase subunit I, partial [Bacteroidales bacterium]
KGHIAIKALEAFQKAKNVGNDIAMQQAQNALIENFKYFGYGYLKNPQDIIPPVALSFYSFRIMVILGTYFIAFFIMVLVLLNLHDREKYKLLQQKWFLYISIISVPLAYICSQSGWIVAEVGRQPWTIQDLLPVQAAVSGISVGNVYTTLVIFFVLFTALLIAELKIMFNQIKKGPDGIE